MRDEPLFHLCVPDLCQRGMLVRLLCGQPEAQEKTSEAQQIARLLCGQPEAQLIARLLVGNLKRN